MISTKTMLVLMVLLMMSACCLKPIYVQDAPESVSYYYCSNCSLPVDKIVLVGDSKDDDSVD